MSEVMEKALAELVELNKVAKLDAGEARQALTGDDPHAATASALLAIESRLEIITVFILAAVVEL